MVDVQRPKAQGYGVKLDEDWYRIAAGPDTPLRIYNQDSLAGREAIRSSAYEEVLDLGYVFARGDWGGGEGLDWYPRIRKSEQRDLDEARFWDSANIDISENGDGDPFVLRLSPGIVPWADGLPTPVIDTGNSRHFFYLAEASVVTWFNSWDLPASPAGTFDLATLTEWNVGTEEVIQIAVGLGDDVMVLTNLGNLYLKPNNSIVFVEAYDSATDGDPIRTIWWAKGRFLGDRQDIAQVGTAEFLELSPVLSGPPGTPVVALTVAVRDTFLGTLNHCVDAGIAIVGAFSDGSIRSYVPIQTTAGDVTSVELQIRGQTPVPSGEEPVLLGFNQGALLFTTIAEEAGLGTNTVRVYESQVLDARFDYIVGNIQFRRQWRGTTEDVDITANMAITRQAIYWTVLEGDGHEWFWRYDLVTTGLSRYTDGGMSALTGFLIFDEVFGAIDTGGDMVYTDQATLQSEGYIITPNINFGLNTDINWIATMLQAQNIQTAQGVQLQLYIADDEEAIVDPDSSLWTLATQISTPGQEGVETPLTNYTSKTVAMQLKFFATLNNTESPEVTRLAIRGLPKHRDWIIELPLNISDYVGVPHRKPARVPYMGDQLHRNIMDLQGSHLQVELLDPPFLFRGVVDNVMNPVEYISDRGAVTKVCTMVLRGNRISGSQPATGDAGLGLGLLGVATLGIGQTGA